MKKQIMITILLLAAILVSVSACSAANLTVGTEGTYSNIQDAYAAAADDGDAIIIANGTYTGDSNREITIRKNINITGQSQAGTIIDAQGAGYIFYIDEGYTVTISQLTLRNGNTTTSGGAIYNDGTLTINKCTFENNTAPSTTDYIGDGGAIYSTGDLTVIDSIFSGNKARWAGGAIASSGTLTVVNSRFTSNRARQGGAIHNWRGTLTVTGSSFLDNVAYDPSGANGGAIHNEGSFTLINSNFTGNSANDNGGAIYNYQGTMMANNCNFIDNNANFGGAINNKDTLDIIDSIFKYNSASSGGAIETWGGDVNLTRCIFTNNTAEVDGGAIDGYSPNLNITGCNFNKNTAGWRGGAIFLSGEDSNAIATVKYSRFVGNIAEELGQDIYLSYAESILDARYNWWGDNNGPAEGRIFISEYSADREIYGPWLVMNINADPSTIYTGKTSKISVNVYTDSNGVDHSADAFQFFNGPEVTFTTNLGNIGSKNVTVPWTLGMAFTILRGEERPGIATLTAADVQTLSSTVNILQAPVTPDEDDAVYPSENEVNAASNTIGMQETGIPIAGLILAILAVFCGLLAPKRK